jgi:hypothetical protein
MTRLTVHSGQVETITARLTSYDEETGLYSWSEIVPGLGDGSPYEVFPVENGGAEGTPTDNPAIEMNGLEVPTLPCDVVLRFRFQHPDLGYIWEFDYTDASAGEFVRLDVVTNVCLLNDEEPTYASGGFGYPFDEEDEEDDGTIEESPDSAKTRILRVEKRKVSVRATNGLGDRKCYDNTLDCCAPVPEDPPSNPPDGGIIGDDPSGCCELFYGGNGVAAEMTAEHISGGYLCLDGLKIHAVYSGAGGRYWYGQNNYFSPLGTGPIHPDALCPEYAVTPPNSCKEGFRFFVWCDGGNWKGVFHIFGGKVWTSGTTPIQGVCGDNVEQTPTTFDVPFTLASGQPYPTGCTQGEAPTFRFSFATAEPIP